MRNGFPHPVPDPDPDPDKKPRINAFDHERLDVYYVAVEFVVEASRLIQELPSGNSHLARQLRQAATSIPLNIAEGAGEYCRNDKARFYRIALRSATECAAILDICKRLTLIESEPAERARELLLRIVAMLTALVRTLTAPGSGSGSGPGSGSGSGSDPR